MLDNRELQSLLAILEDMEDELLAAQLLKDFNERSKTLGTLILNLDPDLDHNVWKKKCDEAQRSVDEIVEKIFSYQR